VFLNRAWRSLPIALVGAASLSGCAIGPLVFPTPFHLSRADFELEEAAPVRKVAQPRFLPWASTEPYLIIVDKTDRKLSLFEYGKEVKVYPVVLGRALGRKLYEGDRKTPSGVYHISEKRVHSRFHRFLDFDYPNHDDLENYRHAVEKGDVPMKGSGPASPGRLVGIHGSDKEDLNRVGVNWTYGCVSLMNRDVEELYDTVPEGTLLLIRDGERP
jgi:murein L,D-transpeptidase YafK